MMDTHGSTYHRKDKNNSLFDNNLSVFSQKITYLSFCLFYEMYPQDDNDSLFDKYDSFMSP